MNNISPISFRGNGTETTGSIAYRNKPTTTCPTCGQVSFKGYDQEEKKGVSMIGALAGVTTLAALTIVGLGYMKKGDVINKMKDGWMKDTISKLKPATEKCYEWCASAKGKGLEYWGKVKNFFSSNKG